MAKKKKSGSKGAAQLPRRLVEGIVQAQEYFDNKDFEEARGLLEKLDQDHPNQLPILELLVHAYSKLKDMRGYEWAVYRLLKAEPNNPNNHLMLTTAYIGNLRPGLAIQAIEKFLSLWPNHEDAPEAKKTLAEAWEAFQTDLDMVDLPKEEALELIAQNDEVRFYLDHQRWSRGRQLAERLLSRHPQFIPALNNLSQIDLLEGDIQHGIQTARKILEIDPTNVHALSNLARMLFVSAQPEEAQAVAARLRASADLNPDTWVKSAEAFSFLGDDRSVLDLYERSRSEKGLDPHGRAYLNHLAAVSIMRMGQEKEARRLWKKALELDPSLLIARINLSDLEGPVEMRNAPWAFPFVGLWVSEALIKELYRLLNTAERHKNGEALISAARRFLQSYPELIFLAPHMLERGGEDARQFVILLATAADHPDLNAALRDFALGQRGSDELRVKAAEWLSEKEILPSGAVRMWSQGEWRDLLLLNFEVTPEAEIQHELPEVQDLASDAIQAMRGQEYQKAQPLLERALALEPDSPSLLNNLAVCLETQGNPERAEAIRREIYQRFPDYFFGALYAANMAIREGNLEEGQQILNELLQRKKMHSSEFIGLAQVQIMALLAEKKPEGAQSWLQLWEKVDPEDPLLEEFRKRVAVAGGFRGILNLFSQQKKK